MLRRGCAVPPRWRATATAPYAHAQRRGKFTVAFNEQHPILANNAAHRGYTLNVWVNADEFERFVAPRLGLQPDECRPRDGERPTHVYVPRRAEFWNLADIANPLPGMRALPEVRMPRWTRNGCEVRHEQLIKVFAAARRDAEADGRPHTNWWVSDWELNRLGLRVRRVRGGPSGSGGAGGDGPERHMPLLQQQLGSDATMRVDPVTILDDRAATLLNACQFTRPDVVACVPVEGRNSEPYFKHLRQLFHLFAKERGVTTSVGDYGATKVAAAAAPLDVPPSGLVFTPRMAHRLELRPSPYAQPLPLSARGDEPHRGLYCLDQCENAEDILRTCGIDADSPPPSAEELSSGAGGGENGGAWTAARGAVLLPAGTVAYRLRPAIVAARKSRYWLWANNLSFAGVTAAVRAGERPVDMQEGDAHTTLGKTLDVLRVADFDSPSDAFRRAGGLSRFEQNQHKRRLAGLPSRSRKAGRAAVDEEEDELMANDDVPTPQEDDATSNSPLTAPPPQEESIVI